MVDDKIMEMAVGMLEGSRKHPVAMPVTTYMGRLIRATNKAEEKRQQKLQERNYSVYRDPEFKAANDALVKAKHCDDDDLEGKKKYYKECKDHIAKCMHNVSTANSSNHDKEMRELLQFLNSIISIEKSLGIYEESEKTPRSKIKESVGIDDSIIEMALEMLETSAVIESGEHARDVADRLNNRSTYGYEITKHLDKADEFVKQGKRSQAKAEYAKAIKILKRVRQEAEKIPDDDFSDWVVRVVHALDLTRHHTYSEISDAWKSGGHIKSATRMMFIRELDHTIANIQIIMDKLDRKVI